MSKQAINDYYNSLERAIKYSKSPNEDTIKNYFWMLLNGYAHERNYEVVREVFCRGTKGRNVKPDGIVKNSWGLDVGYWESKDEKDDLQEEIDAKVNKGYPLTNILFEDSRTAVLYQYGNEVARASVREPDSLYGVINQFLDYRNESITKFEGAIEKFKLDIPVILGTLRKRIDTIGEKNTAYIGARNTFLELCKEVINPAITTADIREMMIQHLLTSDIFNKIFDEPDFHRHNNVAHELEKLVDILFTHSERRNLLTSIEHFYDAINAAAAGIADHHEKQKFLKIIYENFYKVYNPKAADRLGVVYTPNEIVKFMIESTDYLLEKHFGKTLSDHNVEILDPAVGTGTFICDIIEHIPSDKLVFKYKNEIHANEVAILPYYIANLNIEYTFKQRMGYYEEFPNICFVDTLDNVGFAYKYKTDDLFGLSAENAMRIRRQNERKISVIIGNPPYNANQKNENENNKNRQYPKIDKRIKDTYIKASTAQKTKLYDMYARFLRWASDRLNENGVIAFISNNSFIDSRTYDGFRKIASQDFSYIYIIDLKGNARTSGERRRREGGNIFSDQIRVGVAIYFLVKKQDQHSCEVFYNSIRDYAKAHEKIEYLTSSRLSNISFDRIQPDKKNNWINLSEDNDWDKLIPICDKSVKLGDKREGAIFKLFSNGVVTARDEWVYDFRQGLLAEKVKRFVEVYNSEVIRWRESKGKELASDFVNREIKWTSELEEHLVRGDQLKYSKGNIIRSLYRPFVAQYNYFDRIITHRIYQQDMIFDHGLKNLAVTFSGLSSAKPFSVLVVDNVFSFDLLEKTQCLPVYYYDEDKTPHQNISDWGLKQFREHYKDKRITKEEIFHYVYAVLHNPDYRKKYELNLKRDFPRIPFYKNFSKWGEWGKNLMDIHINYEEQKEYPLKVVTAKPEETKEKKKLFPGVEEPKAMFSYKPAIKVKLRANKELGEIELDEVTSLKGIPKQAWEYKLGNRSALEWILDQYKEKKPSDPTIAEKFNTYRFADYKEEVIELLKKVCTVSVETMKIVDEMRNQSG